ncbi:MAG TPA: FkbM family methyltransferase [Polyangiaceae bacterium]|nr:FkbM family methyltransferase [Polyangiaceae bacterium]
MSLGLFDALRSVWSTTRWIWTHPIGARDRRGALVRWARWQVGSRVLQRPAAVPFVEDTVLLVDPGMTGATGNVYVGLHEFADMAFVLHYLRKDDLFVDVGANVGSYTVLASGVCRARTIAIEPLPATFGRLRANVRLNDLGERVRALNVGVASKKGTLTFTRGLDTVNHVATDNEARGGETVEVPVATLDEVAAGSRPSLVKVDVEGFETEVFGGAQRTLEQPTLRGLIVELNGSGARYGFDEGVLERRIESFGFRRYAYDPFARRLQRGDRKSTEGNTLYLRDVDEVERRVRGARPVHVLGVPI